MTSRFSWRSAGMAAAAAAALVLSPAPALAQPASAAQPGSAAQPASAALAAAGGQATATAFPLREAAGDPRRPRRPKLPRTCLTLDAALSTTTGQFDAADEASPPDTARIQAALDRCAGTGRAVELAAGGQGADNAFLSGPLTIGRHEVLLVDDGVTLYASLNPANYQIPAQYPANTCGTVSADGGGCSPFITFAGSGSGLEGTR